MYPNYESGNSILLTKIYEIGSQLSNLGSWKTSLLQYNMVENSPPIKCNEPTIKTTEALLGSSNHACFLIIILDLRSQNILVLMKILLPKWFSKLPCLKLRVVNIKARDIKYSFSYTKSFRGKICAMYNHSMSSGLWESTLVSLWQWWSHVWKCISHIGPLYWFPDKCCLIPGHEPAASPSFRHTTLKKKKEERHLNCPLPQRDVL